MCVGPSDVVRKQVECFKNILKMKTHVLKVLVFNWNTFGVSPFERALREELRPGFLHPPDLSCPMVPKTEN